MTRQESRISVSPSNCLLVNIWLRHIELKLFGL